jgi:hypothetical protein
LAVSCSVAERQQKCLALLLFPGEKEAGSRATLPGGLSFGGLLFVRGPPRSGCYTEFA